MYLTDFTIKNKIIQHIKFIMIIQIPIREQNCAMNVIWLFGDLIIWKESLQM